MSGPQEEDKKLGDSAAHINLKVKGQFSSGSKEAHKLKKLMNAYCDRQSVDFNSISFLFDGRRLRSEQTPDKISIHFHSLEMEGGDEIDAMLHQTGGGTSARMMFTFV